MQSVGAEWKGADGNDGIEGEGSIEMGKRVTAARGLISQGVAEPCAVNSDQEKVILPGEMLRSGLAQLCGGGEVDEAVGEINGRPLETPRRLGLAPEGAGVRF